MAAIQIARLGRGVPYARAQALQRELVQLRRQGAISDTLLLLEHPPVFTLGRVQTCEDNVLASRAEIAAAGASIVQSERGGNVTFHGPGQLVAYPILDLAGHRKDLHWFVHSLEDAMIATAAGFGVTARRGDAGEEGIWVEDRKLGALGVHVTRWVTSHGVALNVNGMVKRLAGARTAQKPTGGPGGPRPAYADPAAFGPQVEPNLSFFDMIVPCGLHARPVTSLAREVAAGRAVGMDEATTRFTTAFSAVFGRDVLDDDSETPAWLSEWRAACQEHSTPTTASTIG